MLEWQTAATVASAARSGRAHGHPAVRRADAGQPAVRRRRAGRRGGARSRARCRRPFRSCCCGSSRRCSPTGSASPSCRAGRRSGRPIASFSGWRPQDVALLRHVCRRVGSRVAAGQRPGGAGAGRRAPHVADQHRHEPAAALAARDLRFIRTSELAERVDATLTTIERLERFEGHLFNWYDSQTLAPLAPRYVSSVDSGNLAAALLTLASGLRETIVEAGPGLAVSDLDDLAILLQQAIEQADVEHKGAWPEAGSFRESARTVRAILSGRASLPQKRENLSGALAALAAAVSALEAGPAGPHESEIAYWAGRLRRRRRGGRTAGRRRARSAGDARAPRDGAGRRHEFPRAVRRAARPAVGRLSSRRRRRPRAPRPVVLRPARLRGAARQLHRDRQGRRPGDALVPPGPARHEHQGRSHAAVVGRHDVRVPDAAPRDAQLSGNAARRNVPDGRAAADPVRRGTRRARGACPNAPTTSSIATAPISTGRSACRASGLRRGLGDDLVVAPYATALAAMVEPAAAVENLRRLGTAGLRAVRLLRRHRLHVARRRFDATAYRLRRKPATAVRRRRPHDDGASPGHDARLHRERAARAADGRALPRRPAHQGDRAAAAGAHAAACAGHAAAPARGHSRDDPDGRRRGAPLPFAGDQVSARGLPVERQLRLHRHATPAAASASAAAAPSRAAGGT